MRLGEHASVWFGAVLQPGRRAVVASMNCRPGDRVLEVGVGTGLSLPLYPAGARVTGIDISANMLAVHRAKAPAARLVLGSALDLPFGDGRFDAATAAGMFDGMQYVGGSFTGAGLGWLLEKYGWGAWGPSMIGFAVIGAILMVRLWNVVPKGGGGH